MGYKGKIGKIDRQGLSNIGCKATGEREGKGKLREKEDREGWAIEGNRDREGKDREEYER